MAVQGGYGILVKINTGSLTTIVGVIDAAFPKQTAFIAESTGHDATSGYYTAVKTGKRRLEPFDIKVAWDDTAATNAAILTNLAAEASVGFSVQDPDGQEIIAFSGHVEAIERAGEQEDLYHAIITVHPTGAPSIT